MPKYRVRAKVTRVVVVDVPDAPDRETAGKIAREKAAKGDHGPPLLPFDETDVVIDRVGEVHDDLDHEDVDYSVS